MVDRPPAETSLPSIRRDLEEMDRAIVLLVTARVDAACTAIRLRSQRDGRIADPAQESRVIARAVAWARQVGLSPTLTKTIFRAIVDSGKERYAALAGPSPSPNRRPAPRRARARVPESGPSTRWARARAAGPT